MASYFREHISVSNEIRDMLIADAALTVAFALIFAGGIGGITSDPRRFLYFIPISLVAVSLSFILHEYMHKIVAQRFGAIAAFQKWNSGILITLASSLFGFLIGLPGATMIYTNRFTAKEEGYVSLAGPLTNFAVFLVFLGIGLFGGAYVSGTYAKDIISVTMFISVWLAFFNMLPIYPLDGSKVLRWNKPAYLATIIVIFAFLYMVAGTYILGSLVFALVIALMFSFMFRAGSLFGGQPRQPY